MIHLFRLEVRENLRIQLLPKPKKQIQQQHIRIKALHLYLLQFIQQKQRVNIRQQRPLRQKKTLLSQIMKQHCLFLKRNQLLLQKQLQHYRLLIQEYKLQALQHKFRLNLNGQVTTLQKNSDLAKAERYQIMSAVQLDFRYMV